MCILCLRRLIRHDLPYFENAVRELQSIPPPTEEELQETARMLEEKYEFDEKKKKWVVKKTWVDQALSKQKLL